jgi:hypothetical protein
MKKFSDDTPESERALALARRLYTGENGVCCLPKLLNPPKSPRAWELLWSAIGRKLAEKQPEFSKGRGRRPGVKNKKAPVDTPWERARQKYRAKKAKRYIPGEPHSPDSELEPGVSLDPVWKR